MGGCWTDRTANVSGGISIGDPTKHSADGTGGTRGTKAGTASPSLSTDGSGGTSGGTRRGVPVEEI